MTRWILLATLLSACNAPEYTGPYDQPGPYTPGTMEGEASGTTGLTLPVTVWFPSNDGGHDLVTYGGLLDGNAYTDVSPACDQPRPVLLFSHGYGGVRWQSPYLGEYLSTHGWIVAAPDHVGNTFSDASASASDLLSRRPQDITDTYNWLIAQSVDPNGPLYGCLDPNDGYAVAGHSFGGYTAYVVGGAKVTDPTGASTLSYADPRVWAVVALAPWDGAGALTDGTADIAVPTMTLSGGQDTTTPWALVSGLATQIRSRPRYIGEFPTGGHFSFSPVACLIPATSGSNGCGDGFIDTDTFTSLVDTSVGSFLEQQRGVHKAIDDLPPESADLTWQIDP